MALRAVARITARQIGSVILNAAGLAVIGFLVYQAEAGKDGLVLQGFLFFLAILLLLIANSHRFESLKAGLTGIEAVVAKAEKVTADAKVVMGALVESHMLSMAYEGRWGGMVATDLEPNRLQMTWRPR